MGWRSASRVVGVNSPSSSRNRTPRWASVTSPGWGLQLPPPTSAGVDAVWCGARNGRTRISLPRCRLTCCRVDARDFQRLRVLERREDGGEPASEHGLPSARWADEQEVVPARGGHFQSLAGEGEAVTSARSSGSSSDGSSAVSLAAVHSGQLASPFRHAAGTRRACAPPRTWTPGTSAASPAFAIGTMTDSMPSRASASTSASVPGTGRTDPSSPSSPRTATPSSTPAGSSSSAPSIPSATASSNPEPDLRTPPGREIHRDALHRPRRPRRQQRGPHPFGVPPHRGVGQADDGVRGQTRRDVDFDGDRLTVDADERGTADRGEHEDLRHDPVSGDRRGASGEVGDQSREHVDGQLHLRAAVDAAGGWAGDADGLRARAPRQRRARSKVDRSPPASPTTSWDAPPTGWACRRTISTTSHGTCRTCRRSTRRSITCCRAS